MALAKSALPAREAGLAASSTTWFFSSSPGRWGSKNRIARRLPPPCLNSMPASLSPVANAPLRGQHRDDHRRRVGAEETATVLGQRHPGPRRLARPAPAAELIGQLDELPAPGRADRMPLGQQAAAEVDRDLAAERGRPGGEQRRALPLPAQAELLVGDQLGGGGRVMQLNDVNVTGPPAGLLVGRLGRALPRSRLPPPAGP